jgi:hypothetical protein
LWPVHLPRGIPSPTTFRPQTFSVSRRLTPGHNFAGLFHPAATSRVRSRSGASPFAQPLSLIERALPPCCCPRPLTVGYKRFRSISKLHAPSPTHFAPRFTVDSPSVAIGHVLNFEALAPSEDTFICFGVIRRSCRSPHRVPVLPGFRVPASSPSPLKPIHSSCCFASLRTLRPPSASFRHVL